MTPDIYIKYEQNSWKYFSFNIRSNDIMRNNIGYLNVTNEDYPHKNHFTHKNHAFYDRP